ncbi:cobalt/nickel transport system permease protein [Nocardioides albertanoniae]|uniref:Cobalt/nickel transport system permease protein n=2 Tax=Nocardioides albertanoniae TaxID=1175486 RepID=A0A543ACN8_9ACTN|nr:cobalt/nickel transport system permease protein [Nocardioides albertanoniae]
MGEAIAISSHLAFSVVSEIAHTHPTQIQEVPMHVPDGFLDAPTSIATGAVAVVAVGVALRGARRELDDKTAPLAGLVAAFVFATQMLNFPVGAGTSGHLMGGALAAVLVGPWTGVLCVSVVLIVQSLLFADGGITALGTNILLMAVTTVVVGWFVSRVLIKVLPKRVGLVAPAAAVGAFFSVPAAALLFTGFYAVGGTADISLTTLATAMLGWHTVIGLGEAAITFLAVGAILSVRPDLVYAARGVIAERDLVIKPKESVA